MGTIGKLLGMRLPQSHARSFSFTLTISLALLTAILESPNVAVAQQLQSSQTNLKFGSVAVGQSETETVTLANTGNSAATVSAISSSNSGFSAPGVRLPLNLAAGQSTQLSIVFAPASTGWAGGRVTLSGTSNVSLTVSGGGVESVGLTASPSNLSFGQVAVGKNVTLPVVLTNTRPWKVTVTGFQAAGTGFSVSGPSVPYVLKGGDKMTLNVTFTPASANTASGSIQISGPASSISLSGTGSTTTTVGQLSMTPSTLSFGNVQVGNSSTQSSVLTANGGNVTITSAVSNNSEFTISGASLPVTINAGQSVALNVVFSPSANGAATGKVTLASNASNNQVTDSVSGTGVPVQQTVVLSWSPSTSSVSGYNVYRGTSVGSYSRINSALDPSETFSDNTVASGSTYYYAATAVNSSGQESGYSSPIKITIP